MCLDGRSYKGKAALETDELLFRGETRHVIRLRDIASAKAQDGELIIVHAHGRTSFQLGASAEKWANKILHPPSRIEKLGVKAGMRVAVLGVRDAGFADEIARQGAEQVARPRKGLDLIFLGLDRPAELKRLITLQRYLQPAGAIWVIYPRGSKTVPESAVRKATLAAGLVDVKVVRFSDVYTSVKLVIPVKRRSR
jgi:hypothetical protein